MCAAAINITVLTVSYNSSQFIGDFLASVQACDLEGIDLSIVVIDNGSSDGTVGQVEREYPDVCVLSNPVNNYAKALNIGIAKASGDYVVICNNDGTVEANWLQGMLQVLLDFPRAGAVQSKIVFSEGGLLNSAGVEEIEHFYYRDIGFEKQDSAQYGQVVQRDFLTGGSLMLRRQCLVDVGDWDDDFILYMEDVDYSIRCRQAGWRLMYAPTSVFRHRFHGTASDALCDYFCARNRFFVVAKHSPGELASCIRTSHFYAREQYDLLYRALLHGALKLCEVHGEAVLKSSLLAVRSVLIEDFGADCNRNFFSQLQLLLGLRPLQVAIIIDGESGVAGHELESVVHEQLSGCDIAILKAENISADYVNDIVIDVCGAGKRNRFGIYSIDASGKGGSGFDRQLSWAASRDEWGALLSEAVLELMGEDALPEGSAGWVE